MGKSLVSCFFETQCTVCYKEIPVPPKITALPYGTLSQALDLEIAPRQVDRAVDKSRRRSSL